MNRTAAEFQQRTGHPHSGTAFYFGYDDHYQQREQFDDQVNITGTGYQQTNRAIFTKFQYLFRY